MALAKAKIATRKRADIMKVQENMQKKVCMPTCSFINVF